MKNEQEFISNFVESCYFNDLDPEDVLNSCKTSKANAKFIADILNSYEDPNGSLNLLEAQDWTPGDADIVRCDGLRVQS